MRELFLNENQISTLMQSRLDLLSNLEVLNLSDNDLAFLASFNNMNSLREIFFLNNAITNFEHDHFAGSVIERINLSDNPLVITEIIIPISLTKLQMDSTAIQTLTIRCVSPDSCDLRTLILESDMLESPIINEVKSTIRYYNLVGTSVGIPAGGLRSDAFTDLPNLKTLQLYKHQFDHYAACSQLDVNTIRSLTVKFLQITDNSLLFESSGLETQSNIDYLALGFNLLTQIPDVTFLPLKVLKLQANSITMIDRSIIAALTLLEDINLEDNPIVNIADFPYDVLPNIGTINIK